MIDNFKVEDTKNYYPIFSQTEPFELFGQMFYPQFNRQGKPIYHISTFKNLVVKIRGSKLTIENSLHKFFHDNNYTDFTHSEIIESIEQIESIFKISSEDLKLKRLEVSINTTYNIQIHSLFQSYIMNEFEKMRSGKTIYGKKCYLSEYNVKGYNKALEFKLNKSNIDLFGNNIFIPKTLNRFELEYKKMRPIKNIVTTLFDLKNPDNLKKLGEKIIKAFEKITMDTFYDYSILSSRQRELFFAGKDVEFWKIEKFNMNTRKKKRSSYNAILKELDKQTTNNPKNDMIQLMKEKVEYLIAC